MSDNEALRRALRHPFSWSGSSVIDDALFWSPSFLSMLLGESCSHLVSLLKRGVYRLGVHRDLHACTVSPYDKRERDFMLSYRGAAALASRVCMAA